MVMLAMAVGMPDTLKYYQNNISDLMFAKYQYVLTSYEDEDGDLITTDNPDSLYPAIGRYDLSADEAHHREK